MSDVFDEVDDGSGPAVSLDQLVKLAEEQVELEALLVRAKAAMVAAKADLDQVKEKRLPAMMEAAGMLEFKLGDGSIVKVKESLKASITKERQAEAFAWLRANKLSALIKNRVTMSFGRGEDEAAAEFFEKLGTDYPDNDRAQVLKVEPGTLVATIEALLKEGEDVPYDVFGIFELKQATVKRPQAKKKKK